MNGSPHRDDPAALARLLRRSASTGTGWSVSAVGPSMAPRIAPGSRLQVVATARAPRIGEVWAFVDASNQVIAHRYLRRTRRGRFVFFGDATQRADDPVRSEWLIGPVIAITTAGQTRRNRRRDGIRPVMYIAGRGAKRRADAVVRRTARRVG